MRLLIHDYAGHPFPVSLSRQLARRGYVVTHAYASHLVTPRGDLEPRIDDSSRLSFLAVPMAPEYRINKYNFTKRLIYEWDYGRELSRVVSDFLPDLVVSGQTPSGPQWALIQAAERLKIPVVTWLQDFYGVAVDKLIRKKVPLIGALVGAWYRQLEKKSLQGSAGIVAITEDFIPIIRSFGVADTNVTVIPNWAPLAEIPLRPKVNSWSVTNRLDDKFVFLYSGTLGLKHNPEILLRLSTFFRQDSEVKVVVVSEGPGADWLLERKRVHSLPNLELVPFQAFGDMPEVLGTADVVVSVLEAEAGVFSVPSKVLTYHAAGKPILGAMPAANLASITIRAQRSGICVEPDDIKGFLENAALLRDDHAMRDMMGKNARVYAEREFNIEEIASRFEKVFRGASGLS